MRIDGTIVAVVVSFLTGCAASGNGPGDDDVVRGDGVGEEAARDDDGVFVAPLANGGLDDDAHGTLSHPYATVSYAIAHRGSARRVYACREVLVDPVIVPSDAVLFVGYGCDGGSERGTTWVLNPDIADTAGADGDEVASATDKP